MYLLNGNESIKEIDIDYFNSESRKMVEEGFKFIEEAYKSLGESVDVGVIYGSVAKNKAKEGSDIDLVFICEDVENYDDLAKPLDKLVKKFDEYEVSPHLIRKSDLQDYKLLNYPPYLTKDRNDEKRFFEYYTNKK